MENHKTEAAQEPKTETGRGDADREKLEQALRESLQKTAGLIEEYVGTECPKGIGENYWQADRRLSAAHATMSAVSDVLLTQTDTVIIAGGCARTHSEERKHDVDGSWIFGTPQATLMEIGFLTQNLFSRITSRITR